MAGASSQYLVKVSSPTAHIWWLCKAATYQHNTPRTRRMSKAGGARQHGAPGFNERSRRQLHRQAGSDWHGGMLFKQLNPHSRLRHNDAACRSLLLPTAAARPLIQRRAR